MIAIARSGRGAKLRWKRRSASREKNLFRYTTLWVADLGCLRYRVERSRWLGEHSTLPDVFRAYCAAGGTEVILSKHRTRGAAQRSCEAHARQLSPDFVLPRARHEASARWPRARGVRG